MDWIDISPWRALFVGALLCAGLFSVLLIAASIVGKRSESFTITFGELGDD